MHLYGVKRSRLFLTTKKGLLPHIKTMSAWTYGELIAGQDTPLRRDSIFPFASISKSATTTLLCMLQEDGGLSLAEPVYKILPEFGTDD